MGKIYEVKKGRQYHYYYRHSWRIKVDGSQDGSQEGKTRGSGPSRVMSQNIYLVPERKMETLLAAGGL